jgi:hypothetical protein
MPRAPLVFAQKFFGVPHPAGECAQHEESEFGGGFGQDIGGIGERDLVLVGVGAVDVVEADRDLRHDFQPDLPCFEYLRIDRIAQRGNQAVDAAADFFQDQLLRRRLGPGIDLDLIAALAQQVNRFPDVAKTRNFLSAISSPIKPIRLRERRDSLKADKNKVVGRLKSGERKGPEMTLCGFRSVGPFRDCRY